MKASIKQISEITGFSIATVSNAINGKKGVNSETSDKIVQVAKEIGYFIGGNIKKIKFVIFKENGEIVSDSPFFTQLIEGVEEASRKFGMDTFFCNLDKRDSDYNQRLQELLTDPSSAILILATEMNEQDARQFLNAVSPVIMFDNWFEKMDFDAVLINNTDATYNIVSYLEMLGHKDIGYLKGSFQIKNFFYRYAGYTRAMNEYDFEIKEENVVSLAPNMKGAYEGMKAFLQTNPKLPTAFIADNDMIALGAMRALREFKIKIPEDVSIVGFDDLPFSEIASTPLTTMRVLKHEMGLAAVKRIMDVIENGSTYKSKVQICNKFIERESVKNLRE